MRKYLIWQSAARVVLALGAAVMLGGYWCTQQQKVSHLQQQIDQLPNDKDRVSLEKDRITLENAVNGSLVQAVGGLLLFVTAYVSWQNLKATQRNVLVAEEKQVTERFTQAINQLGSDKIEIRLGGIYALERIARDSPKDHWTIMEVLTSFIQGKSPSERNQPSMKKQKLAPELAELLHSHLERKQVPSEKFFQLIFHLRDQQLAPEETTELTYMIKRWQLPFELITLLTARKITQDVQAALTVVGRRNSNQDPRSDFIDLRYAYLSEASLVQAKLHGSMLASTNLREAALNFADLSESVFIGADLSGANLEGASLKGADFRKAKGLTPKQVRSAKNWQEAHYDEDFREQLGLPSKPKNS